MRGGGIAKSHPARPVGQGPKRGHRADREAGIRHSAVQHGGAGKGDGLVRTGAQHRRTDGRRLRPVGPAHKKSVELGRGMLRRHGNVSKAAVDALVEGGDVDHCPRIGASVNRSAEVVLRIDNLKGVTDVQDTRQIDSNRPQASPVEHGHVSASGLKLIRADINLGAAVGAAGEIAIGRIGALAETGRCAQDRIARHRGVGAAQDQRGGAADESVPRDREIVATGAVVAEVGRTAIARRAGILERYVILDDVIVRNLTATDKHVSGHAIA